MGLTGSFFILNLLLSCVKQVKNSNYSSGSPLPIINVNTGFPYNNQISDGDPYLDFLITDVCVDNNDSIVNGDPATCSRHRNVRIGERLPFLLTDMDKAVSNVRYQALSSVPIVGKDGTLKVLVTKHFQPQLSEDFKFSYSYDKRITGYDLIDPNGSTASFIRTSDGGCFDQIISTSSLLRRNGWILFGRDLKGGSLNHNIRIDRIDPERPSNCQTSQDTSANTRDVWNPPVSFTFESGKTLGTIVSYHYAHKDFTRTANALERFFFTKEYGFTRWEAWIPLSRCLSENGDTAICHPEWSTNILKGRCTPTGGTDTWGNQTWIRVDCRDSTFHVNLKRPTIPVDLMMANTNGVLDLDSHYNFIIGPELFQVEVYTAKNPDVPRDFSEATRHWIDVGIREGRKAHPTFWVKDYVSLHPEFSTSNLNALIHYSMVGN